MIRGQFKWNALHSSNEAIKFILVDQVYYLKTSHKIDQSIRNNKIRRINDNEPAAAMQKKRVNLMQ